MKVHALARVVLAGSINHIQVSWVKLGREVSQLCMLAGADDYGGTLFEENISRAGGLRQRANMSRSMNSRSAFASWAALPPNATRRTCITSRAIPLSLRSALPPGASRDRHHRRHRPRGFGTGAALGPCRRASRYRLARCRPRPSGSHPNRREGRSTGSVRRPGEQPGGEDVRLRRAYRPVRRSGRPAQAAQAFISVRERC